jgi:hypothetical protein
VIEVWSCAPVGAQSNTVVGSPQPPNTPLPIVVSPTNPVGSSVGVCQLASQTPSSWFTRATSDGMNYAWVTLASLGIGMSSTPAIGTLTISWKAPTTNADGTSPVTPLSGYGIWQGPTATSLKLVTTLSATALTYTTPPLPPGPYFFGIEAIAADGSDSIMSNIVSGTITAPEVPGAPTSVTITATV